MGTAKPCKLLLGIFALLAFVLTAIGLYGVISYSVTQRSRRDGHSPGAGRTEGALLAAMGSGAGLAASFFAARLMRGFLYEIGVSDPVTFIAVPAMLMAVALIASYVPARRATPVDPMVVLRDE